MPSELDLTPLQYQACLMYYGGGKRVDDIATAQGCTHQMVCKRLRAARRKYPNLRREYHRRDFDPFSDI